MVMTTQSKFKNVKTDGYASKLEATVAHLIKGNIPSSFEIREQVKKCCLPATDRYLGIHWVIDFAVIRQGESNGLFIEAKGKPTDSFLLKLRMFESRFPRSYNQLVVVVDRPTHELFKDKNLTVVTTKQLPELLRQFSANHYYEWLRNYRENRK